MESTFARQVNLETTGQPADFSYPHSLSRPCEIAGKIQDWSAPRSLRSARGKELEKVQAFDSQIHIINGVAGGEDRGAEGREGDADEVRTGEDERGLAGGGDADDPVVAVQTRGDVDVALARDGETLRAAEAAIPGAGVAVGLNGPDGFIGRERGSGDEERACGVDGEMIGGDAGLERGVHEDLALGD